MRALLLGARSLQLEEVRQVALEGRKVELGPGAAKKIERCHRYLLKKVQSGKTYYGINTGFGLLADVRIPNADLETLQYNLLRSHSTGAGDPIPVEAARAMLLLRANALVDGNSGVSVGLVQQLLHLLNKGVTPVVPEQGSVGASGDLAPLAHLSLVLIGEGEAFYRGRRMSGASALRAAKIKPIRLGPKEGLALINGTQFMSALGTLAYLEAQYLTDAADLIGAMTLEAFRGSISPFDSLIHQVRPHPGQIESAKRILKYLVVGKQKVKSEIGRSHELCKRVQDPYSLRCMPQVHGATRDTLRFVREVLEREINSVTDNPLLFPSVDKILSGGNFHGQILSMAMDYLSIAVSELASISEERIHKLVNPAISELPAFLVKEGGLNSGFMIVQYAAASIVSENKTLAHPACVDSIPTSADKEDHVSMGAWAARKAGMVVRNTRRVLSMELIAACQGLDLHAPLKTTPFLEKLKKQIRTKVKFVKQDRPFDQDIRHVEELLKKQLIEV